MLVVPVSDRLREAAAEWADARMTDQETALERKAEQALLEVEHLVSGAEAVEFAVEDGAIHVEPSEELQAVLETQADRVDADPATVLGLHLDLFARTFLPSDAKRPPDAPRGNS